MTYTITTTIVGHGETKQFIESPTGDGAKPVDVSIPAATTNKQVNVAATRANLAAVVLYASAAVTVKTNSSGSPQETIELAAGEVRKWTSTEGAGLAGCPFSGNLTAFYLTNAGGSAATFKAWLLEDVTP